MAESVARCDLSEGARRRPHFLGRCDNRVAGTIEGRREIIGLGIGPSDAEPFWSSFLVKRCLDGVKLVISDAHDGLRHAITRVLGANRRRYRVHWMRNALAHVLRGQHTMIAALHLPSLPANRRRDCATNPAVLPISCGRAGQSSPRYGRERA